jgi:hypothetical protein
MAKHPSVFVKLPIVFFLARHSSAAQTANIQARISPADGLNLAPMRRNVHPFARPEFDEGPV